MAEKVINLSTAVTFKLRNKELKVYPLNLEDYIVITEKLKEIGEVKDIDKIDAKKQVAAFVDIIYSIIKNDNNVKKEDLSKILTLSACTKIIQAAVGVDLLSDSLVANE